MTMLYSILCVYIGVFGAMHHTVIAYYEGTEDFLIYFEKDHFDRLNLRSGANEPPIRAAEISAFEYDPLRKCLFYANSTHIARRCLNGSGVYRADVILASYAIANIESLAFDWLSELLYFVDAQGNIEVVQTNLTFEEFDRRTIIRSPSNVQIRDLAVHPTFGYLFWTQYNQSNTSDVGLYRSNLDGSESKVLIRWSDILEPHDLAIDYGTNRVYWIDAGNGYVASCGTDGEDFRIDIEFDDIPTIRYQLSVNHDIVYYTKPSDEEDYKSALVGHNLLTEVVHYLAASEYAYTDLQVFGRTRPSGSNTCSRDHPCLFCISMPAGEHHCVCPDGMFMTKNGTCGCSNGTADDCFRRSIVCEGDGHKCDDSGRCIAA